MKQDNQINKKGLRAWNRRQSNSRLKHHGKMNRIYRHKNPITKKQWDGMVERANARVAKKREVAKTNRSLFSKVKNLFTHRKAGM